MLNFLTNLFRGRPGIDEPTYDAYLVRQAVEDNVGELVELDGCEYLIVGIFGREVTLQNRSTGDARFVPMRRVADALCGLTVGDGGA